LRLPGGAAQKQNKLARNFGSDRVAAVFLDPGQSQINSCRDASGRVNVLVLGPHGLRRFDFHARVALRQFLAELPVRGCSFAIEQAGFRQEKGAHTHGTQAPHAASHAPKPTKERGIADVARADAANEQERVEVTGDGAVVILRDKGEQPAFTLHF